MNFKQIIKEEWEKEFLESVGNFEGSILDSVYGELIEKICTQVWNQAIETAADNADADYNMVGNWNIIEEGAIEVYCLKESILKFKL